MTSDLPLDIYIGSDNTVVAIARECNMPLCRPIDRHKAALSILAHDKLVDALQYARRFLNAQDHDLQFIDEALEIARDGVLTENSK